MEIACGTLVYGVRKTLMYRTEAHVANYESSIGLYKASSKGTTKMEQALEAMKVAE